MNGLTDTTNRQHYSAMQTDTELEVRGFSEDPPLPPFTRRFGSCNDLAACVLFLGGPPVISGIGALITGCGTVPLSIPLIVFGAIFLSAGLFAGGMMQKYGAKYAHIPILSKVGYVSVAVAVATYTATVKARIDSTP